MKNREYALLFIISFVVFYTIMGLLGPLAGLSSFSGPSYSAGVSGGTTNVCSGNLKLSFFPDAADVGHRVSAILSGIQNCNGKIIFVRQHVGSDSVLKCSCAVETGNGCGCSFTADTSVCNNRDFSAQIDMNGNGDYNDPGETTAYTMSVQNCIAP